MLKKLIVCTFLFFVNSNIYANDSDDTLMKQGVWRDQKTNLVWMRCSLGQMWNGTTCTGEVKSYTWQEALDAATIFNSEGGFGGYTDWVVPHIQDLYSIRYCSTGFDGTKAIPNKAGGTLTVDEICKGTFNDFFAKPKRPTVNKSIFPNTAEKTYWSSTSVNKGFAWVINFYYGHGGDDHKSNYRPIRLVRSSQ